MDLGLCRAALARAIEAAGRLGLPVDEAARIETRIRERAGFPGDLYVLAMAGGTGVGKSSLVNALAGREVSRAGARRPTTSEPVAFVSASHAQQVRPLLDWLGGAALQTHEAPELEGVCILDLPDLDSTASEHRARVDSVLPRIDAVLWVSDPEKYQDAVLHDDYLRRWVRRLDHQAMVLNKSDRLSSDDGERLRRDLSKRLVSEGLLQLPVLLVSAHGGIAELRAWLASGVESKRIVSGRMAAEARAAIADLAGAAGVDPDGASPAPLVPEKRRAEAVEQVLAQVMVVVDLPGLERQAVEATKLAARPRGGGPLGLVRTILERGSGRSERVADPQGYLRRWRERGGLVRATQPVRDLVAEALRDVPAAGRPTLAPLADSGELVGRLGSAVDRAVAADEGRFRSPTSRLWPLLGLAQYVATGAVVLGIIWLVALFAGVGRVETPLIEIPIIGPVPAPVVLVAGGLFFSFLINRLLFVHAGWLGRRWARVLRARLARDVTTLATDAAFRPLGAFEAARAELASAAADARSSCAADEEAERDAPVRRT